MPPFLFTDFETRSQLALTGADGVGAYAYAEHPSTKPLCLAWSVDDWPVKIWRPGTSDDYGWEALLKDSKTVKVAHNCEMERSIFRYKLGLDTPIEEWDDTAAMCARIALPRKLEDAAIALKLPVQKDMEGHRVMLKLSKPRKITKNNRDEWWTPEAVPDDFAKLYSYCCDDVRVMREVHRIVPRLSNQEREIWLLTLRANERGVKVDTDAIPLAQALADEIEARLIAEFTALVGVGPNSAVKAAAALGLPDFTEETVRKTLERTDIDAKLRRALELRQLQAYSSIKKIGAFAARVSRDGRLRGSMIYSGAERTQRWSAGGVQIQNFPAGMRKEIEDAFTALKAGCFDLIYEDVLGALSSMLRGFFVGPFLVGDYAQIEARVLAWIAGQMDLVEAFAAGSDPYKQMAADVYAVRFDAVTKAQRDIGKRLILGCGYGMGPDKFNDNCHDLWNVKGVTLDLAQRAVSAYRKKYAKIPKLWKELGDAFVRAVRDGLSEVRVNDQLTTGMTEIAGHPFAYIRLPSGRALFYGWPEIRKSKKSGEDEVIYFGRDNYAPGKKWGLISTWGGKLAENAVQALSRDLLADAALRLDAGGFPLAFSVHDESVNEGTPDRMHEYEKIFNEKPDWAETLAVGVESFATHRYRKN